MIMHCIHYIYIYLIYIYTYLVDEIMDNLWINHGGINWGTCLEPPNPYMVIGLSHMFPVGGYSRRFQAIFVRKIHL